MGFFATLSKMAMKYPGLTRLPPRSSNFAENIGFGRQSLL
jgi:hypothetical protein